MLLDPIHWSGAVRSAWAVLTVNVRGTDVLDSHLEAVVRSALRTVGTARLILAVYFSPRVRAVLGGELCG